MIMYPNPLTFIKITEYNLGVYVIQFLLKEKKYFLKEKNVASRRGNFCNAFIFENSGLQRVLNRNIVYKFNKIIHSFRFYYLL